MTRNTAVHSAVIAAVLGSSLSCAPLPATSRATNEIWGVLTASSDSAGLANAASFSAVADTWIALDTISFRPTVLVSSTGKRAGNRIAIVTSMQGARYHPDVIRAIGANREAAAASAGLTASLLTRSSIDALLIDFQGMTGDDRQAFAEIARALRDSAASRGIMRVGIIVPAADTTGYPAPQLARIADEIVVRLFDEHGVGTPAGPLVTPAWFARYLGARSAQVGGSRIVAGIPVDGIMWTRDSARRITYTAAMALAEKAGTTFVRDPASGNLHAAFTRDGWEIWLSDHVLIERLIAEARRFGVSKFALFGIEGADPDLFISASR